MGALKIQGLTYQGTEIRRNQFGLVCLTDMWKAMGSPENKDPRQWVRLPLTQELVEVLAVNVGKSHILKSAKGRTGGTWAIPNLAISYAKYLAPKFHAWANQAILQRLEEESDPGLAYARGRQCATRGYLRQGKDDRWIQTRLDGIDRRNTFTSTLQDHGVARGKEFALCTNAIYKPLLGGTAKEVKLKRNLSVKAKLRDNLDGVELAAIGLSETLAEDRIHTADLQGLSQCERACATSGDVVAKAVIEFKINPLNPVSYRRLPQKRSG